MSNLIELQTSFYKLEKNKYSITFHGEYYDILWEENIAAPKKGFGHMFAEPYCTCCGSTAPVIKWNGRKYFTQEEAVILAATGQLSGIDIDL